jgi:RTX calcium-binding nonapeptide repeat (4 copies)
MSIPIARRRAAIGAVAGLSLAASLGLAADRADAAYTANVTGDTLQITGDRASDAIALVPTPTTLVVDVGEDGTTDFTFDRSTFSAVSVSAGAGDDEVRVFNAADPLALTIDGGSGADRLLGGNGAETLIGGGGDDFVDGNIGADTARLGTGNDHFQWDPGDGSDTVEGEGGDDALDFNGSNIGEEIGVTANGARVRLTRNVAAIAMDFDGIEAMSLRALGGADAITVGDLTGTALKTADVDFAAFDGGGDASPDTVIATGTDRRDRVQVTRSGAQVLATGLAAQTRIVGSEPADTLRVNTLAGDDDVTVAPDVSDLISPVVDLGADD